MIDPASAQDGDGMLLLIAMLPVIGFFVLVILVGVGQGIYESTQRRRAWAKFNPHHESVSSPNRKQEKV